MQGNVLLSDNGGAQLADFGSAGFASNTLAFTESTTRFGVSLRWAEVISRRLPYADIRGEPAVVTAILHRQHPKRPEDTIPTWSEQGDNLWSLLEACWSWDPDDRPEVALVVELVEPIKSEDLLIKLPETNNNSSSMGLMRDSDAPGVKRRLKRKLKDIEGEAESESEHPNKRPRLETEKPVEIPQAHQHLISRGAALLSYVASRNSQPLNGPFADPASELKYNVNDLKYLLFEIHKLGIDAPEAAQLELLSKQVSGFQQRTRYLFLDRSLWMNPSKIASLDRLEQLAAIGRGLRLRLSELAELERVVARLRFFREVQAANVSGLALDQVEELIVRGQRVDVPPDHQVMVELAREAASGRKWEAYARKWEAYATSLLAQPRPERKELDQPLVSARSVPTLPDVSDKVNRVWVRGREFEDKAEACWRPLQPARAQQPQQPSPLTITLPATLNPSEGPRTFHLDFEMPMATCTADPDAHVAISLAKVNLSEQPTSASGSAPVGSGLLSGVEYDVPGLNDLLSAPLPDIDISFSDYIAGSGEQGTGQTQAGYQVLSADDEDWWHALMDAAFMDVALTSAGVKEQKLVRLVKTSQQWRAHLKGHPTGSRRVRAHRADHQVHQEAGPAKLTRSGRNSPDQALYAQSAPVPVRDLGPTGGIRVWAIARVLAPSADDATSNATDDPAKTEVCVQCRRESRGVGRLALFVQARESMEGVEVPEMQQVPFIISQEGKSYGPAEVRVTYHDDDPEENAKFVDVKACLDNYNWTVIRRVLPPPVGPKITRVELFLFIPGTNRNVEEPEPRPNAYSKSSIESASRQHACESSHNDEGFGCGSESN
ncbi:hypothetical protein FRC12_001963 [Ceratobasidium sp. 428]|nr:hypothetical protein FRC12_001963 [Ceratobasidium sp. 428]